MPGELPLLADSGDELKNDLAHFMRKCFHFKYQLMQLNFAPVACIFVMQHQCHAHCTPCPCDPWFCGQRGCRLRPRALHLALHLALHRACWGTWVFQGAGEPGCCTRSWGPIEQRNTLDNGNRKYQIEGLCYRFVMMRHNLIALTQISIHCL